MYSSLSSMTDLKEKDSDSSGFISSSSYMSSFSGSVR